MSILEQRAGEVQETSVPDRLRQLLRQFYKERLAGPPITPRYLQLVHRSTRVKESPRWPSLIHHWRSHALWPKSEERVAVVMDAILARSDAQAIHEDWAVVENDLFQAVRAYTINAQPGRTEPTCASGDSESRRSK